MPLQKPVVGRRAKRGYRYPPETPKHVVYCLTRIFNALEKCGTNPRPRCEAVALALAAECGGMDDAAYDEFKSGLIGALDEGRQAARLWMSKE
jgi:hypothetical protein